MTPQPPYSFADLLTIMARLRAPDGCPWDREQSHESILNCLIEESYEFVDAVERKDTANMREELGDVLLQVIFHAQMAQEAGTFDVNGVIHDISEKLIRRHPHVFADVAGVDSADKVATQWDAIKKLEKAGKQTVPATGPEGADATDDTQDPGLLGDLPRSMPPLHKAMKISKRAVKAGFEWPDWQGVAAKVREELGEFEAEAKAGADADRDALEMELGDLMFSVVNLGRYLGLDPERALARTNAKFVRRFRDMEAMAKTENIPLEGRSLESLDSLWERAKSKE
jgi:tetrapyrrole methylase family protein/MazG family protein